MKVLHRGNGLGYIALFAMQIMFLAQLNGAQESQENEQPEASTSQDSSQNSTDLKFNSAQNYKHKNIKIINLSL